MGYIYIYLVIVGDLVQIYYSNLKPNDLSMNSINKIVTLMSI